MLKRFFKSLSPPNSAKRTKHTQKSPEIVVEIPSGNSDEPPRILRGLLDSGSTGCILLNEFTKGLKKRFGTTEQWMTKGGIFTTKAKCLVPMILPDFTRQTRVEFDCHVDPTQKSHNTNYDIILGKDFMQELGIDILNSSLTLRWDGIEIPMREFGELRKPVDAIDSFLLDIDRTSDATNDMQNRVTRILDAKYEKADLAQLCRNQPHLTTKEQDMLHTLFAKYEHLFDGTLGEWRGSGVSEKGR